MKMRLRKMTALLMAGLMTFSSLPAAVTVYADELSADDQVMEETDYEYNAGPVTPTRVNDAIKSFTDAMSKFASDTSRLSSLSAFLTRFGGVTSVASGVIGILQMSGVIKDPTMEALGQIINEVYRIEEQIQAIDKRLDDLHEDLVQIAVTQEEKDRNNKADSMIKNWNDFNTNYCEPLDDKIKEYEGKINDGISVWWAQDQHTGIRVLYTKDPGTPSLTYQKAAYEDGFPQRSDNAEAVDADLSFGVEAGDIPQTSGTSFNINSYRSIFEEKMASNLIEAANAKRLDASARFYETWEGLSEDRKKEQAGLYAIDILNTQIYQISCDVMTANNEWVIGVTNAYRKYCNNILTQDSGINAMLNAMFLSHGFEKDIRDELEKFCDGMIAKAGFYGQFALSCACQDNLQSLSNREAVQNQFVDTVLSLTDKKKHTITGHDNFCYVTGTKVTLSTVNLKAVTRLGIKDMWYYQNFGDWKLTAPNMMDTILLQVLYRQYKTGRKDNSSFLSYLHECGTGIPTGFDRYIMTKYNGARSFALNEGIEMIQRSDPYSRMYQPYFEKDKKYRINVGNQAKDSYFKLHDKVTYEAFDLKNEKQRLNEQIARAACVYSQWVFFAFSLLGSEVLDETTTQTNKYIDYTQMTSLDILELEPCKDMNGDGGPEDPFYAFGSPVLTPGVSDIVGPVIDNTKKDITDVTFDKSAYVYSGKAIKPKVTVKAGDKTVPKSGYSISYSDNKKPGRGHVTIKGKGKYAGIVSIPFNIVPKGTSIKNISRGKTYATIKWKKQSDKMPTDRISGYQIRYSTKSSMADAKKVSVKGYGKTSKKIKGLKKNTKYYFQVRTYMKKNGKNIYSDWSPKKSVKTK